MWKLISLIKSHKVAFTLMIALLIVVIYPTVRHEMGPRADVHQYKCAPKSEKQDPDNTKYFPRPSPAPVVKVIELTDDGELVNRCQWTDALNELVKQRGINDPQSTMAVIYIHGWRHNKSSADKERFSELIDRLVQKEKSNEVVGERHVVGIYVAWDAALRFPLPEFIRYPLETFTFWSRKRAADRIAQSAIVAKLVGAVSNIQRPKDDCTTRYSPSCDNRTILLGHSFGGRVLYSATSHNLIHEVQYAHPGKRYGIYKNIKGPADAVILVNPAMEASIFTTMYSLRRLSESFSSEQQPLLFAISTDNDYPNKYAFPVGRWLELTRGSRNTTTLGYYPDYRTHLLSAAKDSEGQPRYDGSEAWSDRFCGGSLCLQRIIDVQPRNPFVVALTTQEIIDGHNGLWSDVFREWMINLILKLDRERKQSYQTVK